MKNWVPKLMALCILIGCACCAGAQDILDQRAEPVPMGSYYYSNIGIQGSTVALDVAQTFTPSVSRRLSRIGFQVYRNDMPTSPLIVDIRPVGSGVPAQTNLSAIGSVMIDASELPSRQSGAPPWTYADFGSLNINVVAGVPLAIVLRSNQAYSFPSPWIGYSWFSSNQEANIYLGGTTWDRTGGSQGAWRERIGGTITDMSFQEYVVAEPATGLIAIGAIPVCWWIGRRRSQIKAGSLAIQSHGSAGDIDSAACQIAS